MKSARIQTTSCSIDVPDKSFQTTYCIAAWLAPLCSWRKRGSCECRKINWLRVPASFLFGYIVTVGVGEFASVLGACIIFSVTASNVERSVRRLRRISDTSTNVSFKVREISDWWNTVKMQTCRVNSRVISAQGGSLTIPLWIRRFTNKRVGVTGLSFILFAVLTCEFFRLLFYLLYE